MTPFIYTIDTNGLILKTILVNHVEKHDSKYVRIQGTLLKESTTSRLWGHVNTRTRELNEQYDDIVPEHTLKRQHWDHCVC